ncbi:hypothetical protein EJB05_42049, partial [Eragrostis curvula]
MVSLGLAMSEAESNGILACDKSKVSVEELLKVMNAAELGLGALVELLKLARLAQQADGVSRTAPRSSSILTAMATASSALIAPRSMSAYIPFGSNARIRREEYLQESVPSRRCGGKHNKSEHSNARQRQKEAR